MTRDISAISALLVGLFWLENAWEVWDAKGEPLARFGNLASGYGLGVAAFTTPCGTAIGHSGNIAG